MGFERPILRLTRDSKASGVTPTYTYDGNGNRKTRTAGTYPAQSFTYVLGTNRDASTVYDGMGNSTKNLATYDASGRLDSLTEGQNMIHTSYNGQGELARTVNGFFDLCTNAWVTMAVDDFVFTPDGRALSIRTASTSAINVDYVWLDNLPVAQFQDSIDTSNNVIATELTFLHSDHLGTPRYGTSPARTVTWTNQGDAFGIPALSGSATVRLRFPGQVSFGFLLENYNYYRDYDPNLGRYLESDPIGLVGTTNSFAYATLNPLGFLDLNGRQAQAPNSGSGHPVLVDPNTGKPIIDPIPRKQIPEVRPPEPDLKKAPKVGRTCGAVFRACLAACTPRCPGPPIVKGLVCGPFCITAYVVCLSDGGDPD